MISEKEFDSILLKFLIEEPFFASIIRSMRLVREESISTAGVSYQDGVMTLYWSPTFVSSLSIQKIFGLLKHECYHLIFKHVTSRKQEPHNCWNIATDLAINSIIPRDELPECGLIPGVLNKIPDKEDAEIDEEHLNRISKLRLYIASLPAGMSSEWYMEKILSDQEIKEIIDELKAEDLIVVLDVHDDRELSESEKIIADQKIKNIIAQAIETANNRSWGSVSISTKAQIEKITKTEFNWERALKYFCGHKMKSDTFKTQRKINRKYPYIHPGKKSRKTSSLAIYIDQSGSIGQDALKNFGNVLERLSKTHTFVYYYFDSFVEEESKTIWKKGKSTNFSRRLTGGTDFNAVEEHYRKIGKDFDGYIIMTDGIAPKPKPCISKRCWVISPGGKMIFSPDKKDHVIKMN
jgi:predicted metal-dependent peptidase